MTIILHPKCPKPGKVLIMVEFGKPIGGVYYPDRPGAYAIIQDPSRAIALVKTSKGCFLPGGGVEPGEDLKAALCREVREETGFAITVGEEFASASQYLFAKSDGRYFRKIGHFFHAALAEKISAPTETDHEMVWRSPDESIRQLTHEFQKWAIREALNGAR